MNYKKYLEEHTNWAVQSVHTQAQSVVYKWRRPGVPGTLEMELLPEAAVVLTLGNERRTIPSPDVVSKVYGREATDMDMLKLFNQVLMRLEESCKGDMRDIEQAFGRYSRKHK